MHRLGLIPITKEINLYLANLGYSNDQIRDFLYNAEILIDSGWECSETGFKSVWINLEKDKICLVNEHEDRYISDKSWHMVIEEDSDGFTFY